MYRFVRSRHILSTIQASPLGLQTPSFLFNALSLSIGFCVNHSAMKDATATARAGDLQSESAPSIESIEHLQRLFFKFQLVFAKRLCSRQDGAMTI